MASSTLSTSYPISEPRYWAVIPAAGTGQRFGQAVSKQYLEVQGKTILRHTFDRLQQISWLSAIVIVVRSDDTSFDRSTYETLDKALITEGGDSRSQSVLCGLQALGSQADKNDWVLVHDAARPCVSVADIEKLKETLGEQDSCGILACPVRDTVKRGDANAIVERTIEREGLWLASTPQQCRFGQLREALATNNLSGITDEASAMEANGAAVKLVQGGAENIKITHPEDLFLANAILSYQSGLT